MKITTFSNILNQIVEETNVSGKKLCTSINKTLSENNSTMQISYPCFASYRNFRAVPSMDRAAAILKCVNYEISNSDLAEILEYSKRELKKVNDDRKDIQQGLRIKPENFSETCSVTQLELALMQRVKELYGSSGSLNQYVNDLIKQDLQRSGYQL